jgi:hypothetical protein
MSGCRMGDGCRQKCDATTEACSKPVFATGGRSAAGPQPKKRAHHGGTEDTEARWRNVEQMEGVEESLGSSDGFLEADPSLRSRMTCLAEMGF